MLPRDHIPVTPVVGEAGPNPALTRNRRPCPAPGHGEPEHPPRRVPNTRCRGKQRVGPPDHRRLPAVAAGRKPCLSSIAPPWRCSPPPWWSPCGHRAARPGRRRVPCLRPGTAPPGCRSQLTDGLIHNPNFGGFDDYGLTADTVLRAAGHRWPPGADVPRRGTALAAARRRLHRRFGTRAVRRRHREAARARPVDRSRPHELRWCQPGRAARQRVVIASGPAKGRIDDKSTFGDFANTVGQILAVRGLTDGQEPARGRGPHVPAQAAVRRRGYFRLDFAKVEGSQAGAAGKKSPADPDTTSYAVIQLLDDEQGVPGSAPALRTPSPGSREPAAQERLVRRWHRRRPTANTNSTGLAGWALGADRAVPARPRPRHWVREHQAAAAPMPGTPLAGRARSDRLRPRRAARPGKQDGITDDDARPVAPGHGPGRAGTAVPARLLSARVLRLRRTPRRRGLPGRGGGARRAARPPAQAATCSTSTRRLGRRRLPPARRRRPDRLRRGRGGQYAAAQFTRRRPHPDLRPAPAGRSSAGSTALRPTPCVQHPARECLLVAVVVRRQVRHLVLLRRAGVGVAERPRRWVRRAVVAGRCGKAPPRVTPTSHLPRRRPRRTSRRRRPRASPTPGLDTRPPTPPVPRSRAAPSLPPRRPAVHRRPVPPRVLASRRGLGSSADALGGLVRRRAGCSADRAARHLRARLGSGLPGWVAPVVVAAPVRARAADRRRRTTEALRRRLMTRPALAVARLPRDLHPVALVALGGRAGRRGVLHHQPVDPPAR